MAPLDPPTTEQRAEQIEALIDSNKMVADKLDQEEYWRNARRRSDNRWRWAALTTSVVLVLVLAALGIILSKVLDTADAVRQTQLTGTPTGRVLLCAASPDVLDATTREEQRARLEDCFERNGVSVYDFISPPTTSTTTQPQPEGTLP